MTRDDVLGRWSAWLFIIGGSCFAIASMPFASSVSTVAVAATYGVGALFFTSAAFLQLRTTDGLAWRASLVQFIGTLYFNVNTIRALVEAIDGDDDLVVWRPEALGSICFLVASVLAFGVVVGGGRRVVDDPWSHEWWMSAWNLAGSVLFGVSTAAGWVVSSTQQPLDAALMNSTTMFGALCFVVASALDVRTRRSARPPHRSGRADHLLPHAPRSSRSSRSGRSIRHRAR